MPDNIKLIKEVVVKCGSNYKEAEWVEFQGKPNIEYKLTTKGIRVDGNKELITNWKKYESESIEKAGGFLHVIVASSESKVSDDWIDIIIEDEIEGKTGDAFNGKPGEGFLIKMFSPTSSSPEKYQYVGRLEIIICTKDVVISAMPILLELESLMKEMLEEERQSSDSVMMQKFPEYIANLVEITKKLFSSFDLFKRMAEISNFKLDLGGQITDKTSTVDNLNLTGQRSELMRQNTVIMMLILDLCKAIHSMALRTNLRENRERRKIFYDIETFEKDIYPIIRDFWIFDKRIPHRFSVEEVIKNAHMAIEQQDMAAALKILEESLLEYEFYVGELNRNIEEPPDEITCADNYYIGDALRYLKQVRENMNYYKKLVENEIKRL